MRVATGLALCVALSGCVTAAPPTREAWLSMTSRDYVGLKREAVIKAAQAVIENSKPPGLSFAHDQAGFTATIPYFIYVVIASENGQYIWQFSAAGEGADTKAEVHLSKATTGTAGTLSPVIGGSGGVVATGISSSSGATPVDSAFTYQLFWDRVDYVLGKRIDWRKCRDVAATKEKGSGAPDFSGLCRSDRDYEPQPPAREAAP